MDVYDVMELYKEEYGEEINAKDKDNFYAILAFWAIKRLYQMKQNLKIMRNGKKLNHIFFYNG